LESTSGVGRVKEGSIYGFIPMYENKIKPTEIILKRGRGTK
jgi:hypothetical protein